MNPFAETPEDVGKDLADCLTRYGQRTTVKQVTSLIRRGSYRTRLDALMPLPDAQQIMFAQRIFCAMNRRTLTNAITYYDKCSLFNLLAVAQGYRHTADESALARIPGNVAILVAIMAPFIQRLAGGDSDRKKVGQHYAEKMIACANSASLSLHPEGTPFAPEVLRTRFRIVLQQQLVCNGPGSGYLQQSLSWAKETARKLFMLRQVGSYVRDEVATANHHKKRCKWNPDGTALPEMPVVDAALSLFPKDGYSLSRQYVEAYAAGECSQRNFHGIAARLSLDALTDEIDAKKSLRESTCGKVRASVAILARATGVGAWDELDFLRHARDRRTKNFQQWVMRFGAKTIYSKPVQQHVCEALLKIQKYLAKHLPALYIGR